jgi:hypothetical protein
MTKFIDIATPAEQKYIIFGDMDVTADGLARMRAGLETMSDSVNYQLLAFLYAKRNEKENCLDCLKQIKNADDLSIAIQGLLNQNFLTREDLKKLTEPSETVIVKRV